MSKPTTQAQARPSVAPGRLFLEADLRGTNRPTAEDAAGALDLGKGATNGEDR
ncbi:hypothetical protein ACFY05_06635 [Microtetraspora fusca]|uniref:Uncharacterized protein n=1 Tax=Microtetraspora fusca TaxID=1997 RepID=A0ABW6UZN6_MICFU